MTKPSALFVRVPNAGRTPMADVIVTLGCGDECPYVPGKSYEDWKIPDPANLPLASVRPIRDEIRDRVEKLIRQLTPES